MTGKKQQKPNEINPKGGPEGSLSRETGSIETDRVGMSLVVQWLRLSLTRLGVWIPSQVGELRFHILHGPNTKT